MGDVNENRVRFVVLSTQRSGSNWLEDRLNAHSQVTVHRSEPFRKTLDADYAYRHFRNASNATRALAFMAPPVAKDRYLSWLEAQTTSRAVGFRLMYDQLRRNPSLGPLLAVRGFRFVHLVRTNVLETLVSTVAARESGLYVTRSESKKTNPVWLDPTTLVDVLSRRQALIDRHRSVLRFVQSLELSYEDYIDDPIAGDRSLASFLDVAHEALTSEVQRSGHRDLRQRIQNLNEVSAALAGSGFASALHRP